jgi:ArsR family metal-binding transcriptional regulator
MSDPLVKSIALTRTHPCLAEPGKIVVVGKPDALIAEVLPFLNALLPNVISYNPRGGVMTLRRQPGLITLYPDQVMITQVADTNEGLELLAALRDLLNQTWAQRATIVPQIEGRERVRPLDVYAVLPRTNCRGCAEATCMAFAFGLIQGQHSVDECPVLVEPIWAEQRSVLVQWFGA